MKLGFLGVAVGMVLAGPLAGCGADDAGSEDRGPVITIGKDWNGYPEALFNAKLTLTDNCLFLGGDVVFWPTGTRWDSGDRTVVVAPDGGRVVVGERYVGGGGVYSPDDTDFADLLGSSSAANRIEECLRVAPSASGEEVGVWSRPVRPPSTPGHTGRRRQG